MIFRRRSVLPNWEELARGVAVAVIFIAVAVVLLVLLAR
jgi:hypothetical protein